MKIGILVHSKTGNTYSVAEKLEERLLKEGHLVTLEKVIAENDKMKAEEMKLLSRPDPEGYDALVFACPVWAFSLSTVMNCYLSQLPAQDSKTAACFVTQSFPFSWMGGKRAIKQTMQLCKTKGIQVKQTGIINWSNKKREDQINDLVDKLSQVLH